MLNNHQNDQKWASREYEPYRLSAIKTLCERGKKMRRMIWMGKRKRHGEKRRFWRKLDHAAKKTGNQAKQKNDMRPGKQRRIEGEKEKRTKLMPHTFAAYIMYKKRRPISFSFFYPFGHPRTCCSSWAEAFRKKSETACGRVITDGVRSCIDIFTFLFRRLRCHSF